MDLVGLDMIASVRFVSEGEMSWLPKRDKLDPVQASAIDFVVAQEGNFYIKGEAGTGRAEWALG